MDRGGVVPSWVWGTTVLPGAWGWADASGDQLPKARMLQLTPANSRAARWQRVGDCVVIKVWAEEKRPAGHCAIHRSILVSRWVERDSACMGSSRLGRYNRNEAIDRWPRLVMAVLASIGAVDTGLITLKRWQIVPELACPVTGDGCDIVLNSPWATVLGQPLALFGFLAYATVLAVAVAPLLAPRQSRWQLNRATWPLLMPLCLAMAVFSLSLVVLMVAVIQAFCFFCLLSAVLSVLLFLIALLGHSWDDVGAQVFRALIITLVVAVVSFAWIQASHPDRQVANRDGRHPPAITTPSNEAQIALARHLNATGAVVYTAYWCPACRVQKELFGKQAAKELAIVECARDGYKAQPQLCGEKGIESYPTWEFDDALLTPGIKNPEELADVSGYAGERLFPTLPSEPYSSPSGSSPRP